MLIANGHIKLQTGTSGGGIVNGIPQPITDTWGANIECQYRANQYSNLGVVSGNAFTQHSYEVLVDLQTINSERLELYNSSGQKVGEFSVISAEKLPHVDLIKIKV